MLLVFDVGNTNTVVGIYSGKKLVEHWRLTTQKRTTDEIVIAILNLLNGSRVKREDIDSAIYASVVPSLDEIYLEAIERCFDVQCLKVSVDLDLGMEVKLKTPSEVGADRLLNAVAAKEKYGAPFIVVDLGTAITLDVVSDEGAYLGGAIAPGMESGMELLFSRTAKLPQISLVAPEQYIGRSTVEAIRSGIVYGFVGMIDTLARGIFAELGGSCKVIATGGHAKILAEHSQVVTDVDPWLTLDGLRILNEKNRLA